MTNPKRIRVKGEECNYIMESVAPSKSGKKVKYNGEVYVKEELPSEYVMFEGIAYKRGVSIDEYNRKVMTESANGKVPSKIRLKGTNIVLEAISLKHNGNAVNKSDIKDALVSYSAVLSKVLGAVNSAAAQIDTLSDEGLEYYVNVTNPNDGPGQTAYGLAVDGQYELDTVLRVIEQTMEYAKHKKSENTTIDATGQGAI